MHNRLSSNAFCHSDQGRGTSAGGVRIDRGIAVANASLVAVLDPVAQVSITGGRDIAPLAKQAKQKLERALAAICVSPEECGTFPGSPV